MAPPCASSSDPWKRRGKRVTKRYTLPMRLMRARQALQTDEVLTAPQLQRHYALTEENIADHFPCRPTTFRPLGNSSKMETTTFCMLDHQALLWAPSWKLSHQASTAELRHLLDLPVTAWHLEGGERDTQRPDALATLQGYQLAIEHDAGYAPARTREKIHAFEMYDYTVWGTLSRARKSHLEARYSDKILFVHTNITSPELPATSLDLTQTILAQLGSRPVAGAPVSAARSGTAPPGPPAGSSSRSQSS